MAHVEREFELSRRDKDGVALRDHLRVVAQQTGEMPPELEVPPCPPELAYLLGMYYELASARGSNGFGLNPISYAELAAYAQLTATDFTPFEVQVLRQVDGVFLSIFNRAANGH